MASREPSSVTVADDERPWLTLTEAAAASGLDRETIRSRARRGLILRRRDNRGQWLVQIAPDFDHGQDRGLARGLETAPAMVTDRDRGNAHGRDTTDHGREVIADLLAEVAELRIALARAETERDTGKGIHDAETALLREALAREADHVRQERIRADRLEAVLAEARRPWLLRLVEGMRRKG